MALYKFCIIIIIIKNQGSFVAASI